MSKLWILLAVLLAVGAFVWIKSCRAEPLASRQTAAVDAAAAAKAGDFAVKAIELGQTRPREFARLWADAGDVYQSSVNVLREHPLKQPKPGKIYCYSSGKQRIYVELSEDRQPGLIVTLWQSGDEFTLTEIAVMEASK